MVQYHVERGLGVEITLQKCVASWHGVGVQVMIQEVSESKKYNKKICMEQENATFLAKTRSDRHKLKTVTVVDGMAGRPNGELKFIADMRRVRWQS